MNSYVSTFDMLHLYLFSDQENRNKAVIDNWAKEVVERDSYDFEFGIVGLGWLIGYLIDTNYMEGNADEILEDIDDLVYKLTIREVTAENSDIDVLLDYLTYYQQRIKVKSLAPYYRCFTHLECLKLLLGKLNNILVKFQNLNPKNVRARSKIILKYTYLVKISGIEPLLEEALYTGIEEMIHFFEKQDNVIIYIQDIAKLYIAVRQYESLYWEAKLKKLLGTSYCDENRWVQ